MVLLNFILVENVLLKSQVLGGKCEGEGEGGKGNCHFLSGTHRQRAMHLGKPIFVLGNKNAILDGCKEHFENINLREVNQLNLMVSSLPNGIASS